MEITIDKNELYSFIKRAVKEALEEETLGLFLKNIPPISQEEMEDIEKHMVNHPPKRNQYIARR